MADAAGHIAAAHRAANALQCLRNDGEKKHLAWIATVAFYEALHWTAAVAAALGIPPATSHQSRSDQLADDQRLTKYLHSHEKLLNASLIARYLNDYRGNTAERYFSQIGVLHRILNEWLGNIRKCAKQDLTSMGIPVTEIAPAAVPSPKSGTGDKR